MLYKRVCYTVLSILCPLFSFSFFLICLVVHFRCVNLVKLFNLIYAENSIVARCVCQSLLRFVYEMRMQSSSMLHIYLIVYANELHQHRSTISDCLIFRLLFNINCCYPCTFCTFTTAIVYMNINFIAVNSILASTPN